MKRLSIILLAIVFAGLFSSCARMDSDLFHALSLENLELVKEAVENGADVNKGDPLFYSLSHGQDFIPEYLLYKGRQSKLYRPRRNLITDVYSRCSQGWWT